MKRFISLALVFVVIMFAMTISAAAEEGRKSPVSKVVSTTMDTTKKVGTTAADTVGVISEGAVTATKDITGPVGDVVKSVSSGVVTATSDVVTTAGDTVKTVYDTAEQTVTGDTK